MKFQIKHLLLATACIAVGIAFSGEFRFQHLVLAVAHLFAWWLSGLNLLNPRLRKIPVSIIALGVSYVAVTFGWPNLAFHSPMNEWALVAVVVLAFRIFLAPPLTQNEKIILGYGVIVSAISALLTATHNGDVIHFSAMWLMTTVCVGLIHLKLTRLRQKRVRWLDITSRVLMWTGLIGIVLAALTICICFMRNTQTSDLQNLFLGMIAYLVACASWIAISVGVASHLIAEPKPSFMKTGMFQSVCLFGLAVQLTFELYAYNFFLS